MQEQDKATKWFLGILSFLGGCTVGEWLAILFHRKKALDEERKKRKRTLKKKEELVLNYEDLIFTEDNTNAL